MKVLVTGGAGYIGGVVVTQLVAAGHHVTVLDDLSTGHADTVPSAATLHRLDVEDAAKVVTPNAGFDAVLHFAAKIAAGESMARPDTYWWTNVVGSLALLRAMRDAQVPRLVFSSSAAVYGDPLESPITERAAPAPTSPYGWTKLAVDAAISQQCAAYGLGATSLRYFNVAGATFPARGPALGERHDPETHLIPIALDVVTGRRRSLKIFGDDYPTRDGTCVRDYIHVEDLAAAHLLALEHTAAGEHAVYNLGNGNGYSNREVVEVVRDVTGHPIPVETAPRRPGDPAELVASSARAATALGWVPRKPDLHAIVQDAWDFVHDGQGAH